MEKFTVRNCGEILAEPESDSPESAAIAAFEDAFRRPYEVKESHGPNWGIGSDRIDGNGAQNLDHCADVYLGEQHVARIEMREVEFDRG